MISPVIGGDIGTEKQEAAHAAFLLSWKAGQSCVSFGCY